MKAFGITVACLLVFVGLPWLVMGNDFFLAKYFAPKHEQLRHEVFKESQSYNDGMIQELQSMWLEYQKAEPEHKAALRSVILHRYASYDESRLPSDLQVFMRNLKEQGR